MGLPYMKQIAGGRESNIPVENVKELEAMKEQHRQEVVRKVESAVERDLKMTGSGRPPGASITVLAKQYGQVASDVFLKNGPSISEFDQADDLERQLEEIELPVQLADTQLERARFAAIVAYAQALRHEEEPSEPDPETVLKMMHSFHEKAKAIREQYGSLQW